MKEKMHRGVIALDIDGTVTRSDHTVPKEVVNYLEYLHEDGWQIAFVTGRSFAYGYSLLESFSFTYYFGCENGATLLEMPSRKVVHTAYFEMDRLTWLRDAARALGKDVVIHTGIEAGGHAYWCPSRFSQEEYHYLRLREKTTTEPWIELRDFADAALEEFAYAKCFGRQKELEQLAEDLQSRAQWSISIIRDPLRPGFHVALITHPEGGKGGVVRRLRQEYSKGGPLIAAGDDLNDVSLLEEADIAIAMGSAPPEVCAVADIHAPSAEESGVIAGIKEAIDKLAGGIES